MNYKNEKTEKLLKQLDDLQVQIDRLSHVANVIDYDMQTAAPKKGMKDDSDDLSLISSKINKIIKSDKYESLIEELHSRLDQLNVWEKRMIELLYRDLEVSKKWSAKELDERTKIFNDAYISWIGAKEKNDYSIFLPQFEKVKESEIKAAKKLTEDEKDKDLYTKLFKGYEYGFTTKDLDKFFNQLEDGILTLINDIKKSNHQLRHDFLNRKVNLGKQAEFSKKLLEFNGFDFERGSLSTTEHPFTSQFSKDDVRVTTHYYENNFISNMFSIIHEGGHALFGQNVNENTFKYHMEGSLSMAKHESVSRLYENVIGRSKEYIHAIYPMFKETFKDEFSDVSENDLYEGVNWIDFKNKVRTEADELTYSLHIIIRYKIEKMIMNENISLTDAKKIWNKLYKDLLDVDVLTDSEGILQDVHWTSGFSYFPTYALGNALNCIYVEKMAKAFDYKKEIYNGNMAKINQWLKDNVYSIAPLYDTKEWIKKISTKSFSADAYLNYLNVKYRDLYKIN